LNIHNFSLWCGGDDVLLYAIALNGGTLGMALLARWMRSGIKAIG
jgi:hypothetical protein